MAPQIGSRQTLEHRAKCAALRVGTRRSAETRRKMSESMKRYYAEHPEFRLATRNVKGFAGPHTEETRQKMSATRTGVLRPGHSARMSGPGNPAWIGGLSYEPYTAEFSPALKRAIRERDGFTCQLCFAPENGRKHAIHHIDYDKKNCRGNNLITLCGACNGRVNRSRDFWTKHFQGRVGA